MKIDNLVDIPGVLIANTEDNVATIISHKASEMLDIPFGHKAALVDIKAGESIVKYGVVIGIATENIDQGVHVHVHNCA